MTDDRILRGFAEFDAPARPSTAFTERLYAELVTDLHLETVPAGGAARHGTRSRLRVVALLAAAVALLLAILAGALLTLSRPSVPPTPLELVQLSRGAYAHPPAVRFAILDVSGATTVASDGKGTWRSESRDLTPGSYFLYDGTRYGIYDAMVRTWAVFEVTNGGPPFPFNSEFTWTEVSFPGLRATLAEVDCADAEALAGATILGRAADGIWCPRIGMRYFGSTARPTWCSVLRPTRVHGSA